VVARASPTSAESRSETFESSNPPGETKGREVHPVFGRSCVSGFDSVSEPSESMESAHETLGSGELGEGLRNDRMAQR
jgi:hypothetical protein